MRIEDGWAYLGGCDECEMCDNDGDESGGESVACVLACRTLTRLPPRLTR